MSYSFLKPSKVADLLYIATDTLKFLKLFKTCDFSQKKKKDFPEKKLLKVSNLLYNATEKIRLLKTFSTWLF